MSPTKACSALGRKIEVRSYLEFFGLRSLLVQRVYKHFGRRVWRRAPI